jgi:hypothetical protein
MQDLKKLIGKDVDFSYYFGNDIIGYPSKRCGRGIVKEVTKTQVIFKRKTSELKISIKDLYKIVDAKSNIIWINKQKVIQRTKDIDNLSGHAYILYFIYLGILIIIGVLFASTDMANWLMINRILGLFGFLGALLGSYLVRFGYYQIKENVLIEYERLLELETGIEW